MRSFRRDEAGDAVYTVLGILSIVLVPLVLFVLVYRYLRHASPEGAVLGGASAGAKAPILDDPNAPISGARKCRRCGNTVRPFKTSHGPECPNCGAGMGG